MRVLLRPLSFASGKCEVFSTMTTSLWKLSASGQRTMAGSPWRGRCPHFPNRRRFSHGNIFVSLDPLLVLVFIPGANKARSVAQKSKLIVTELSFSSSTFVRSGSRGLGTGLTSEFLCIVWHGFEENSEHSLPPWRIATETQSWDNMVSLTRLGRSALRYFRSFCQKRKRKVSGRN